MQHIVVVGSINMDVVVKVQHIPEIGETILAKEVSNHAGGKGANQAVAASRLGACVHMIGRVGDDQYGKELVKKLKDNNVLIDGIEYDKTAPTGTAYIYVSDAGENNIVVCQGANAMIDKHQIDRNIELIKKADICIVQLEIPFDIVKYVADICFENGVKLIFNPAPAIMGIGEDILKKTYAIVPNETELSIMTNSTIDSLHDVEKVSKTLVDSGAQNVIVTLGEKGSLFMCNDCIKKYDAIQVKAIDTTAAGDSFIGALSTALVEGKDISKAIEYAAFVSALTVTKEGAQDSLPYKEEVEKFIKK